MSSLLPSTVVRPARSTGGQISNAGLVLMGMVSLYIVWQGDQTRFWGYLTSSTVHGPHVETNSVPSLLQSRLTSACNRTYMTRSMQSGRQEAMTHLCTWYGTMVWHNSDSQPRYPEFHLPNQRSSDPSSLGRQSWLRNQEHRPAQPLLLPLARGGPINAAQRRTTNITEQVGGPRGAWIRLVHQGRYKNNTSL